MLTPFRITFHETTDQYIIFRLTGVKTSFANALRKIILCNVPSLAFDYTEIYENTSCLPDEQIAHRIGLLPLQADPSAFKFPEECDCEDFCEKCSVDFVLDSKELTHNHNRFILTQNHLKRVSSPSPQYGLPNESTATLSDTIPGSASSLGADSTIPPLTTVGFVEQQGIPLCVIKGKQSLSLKTRAILGTGSAHAKFCPATIAAYYIERDVSVNIKELSALDPATQESFVRGCPNKCKNILAFLEAKSNENKGEYLEKHKGRKMSAEKVSELKRFFEGLQCKRDRKSKYYKYCEDCERNAREMGIPQILIVGKNKPEYLFEIEGDGSMKPIKILKEALRIIQQHNQNMLDAINEFI